MTPFGEKMKALRAEKGLTQQQQADQLGVSKAYISAL
ncbi:MAG TPA: transcriptional regulator, partial [Alphaproteobacteria bacterium]|nr:transcriptional regulator [Alphaproteobacteria bacterium]